MTVSVPDLFTHKFLSEPVILRRRAIRSWGPWLVAGLAMLSIGVLVKPATFYQVCNGVLLAGLISIFAQVFMEVAIGSEEDYQWLPSEDCQQLANYCEQHVGLQPYRDQVRAAGRLFTKGEYRAMAQWAEAKVVAEDMRVASLHHAAGCRALYGLPAQNE